DRLAGELAAREGKMVVVHGAGSFGHFKVHKYGIKDGRIPPDKIEIVTEIHRDLHLLGGYVLDALAGAGINAVLLPGHTVARVGDDGLELRGDLFAGFVGMGTVPVTNGDVVLNGSKRFAVCSGDLLMVELARQLKPDKAVFVTRADGIVAGGKLREEISPDEEIDDLGARGADVTGSMEGKWSAAREIARSGIPVHFVSGEVQGRLAGVMRGEDVISTKVRLPR
ncbi:MAG: isopentenyl phosphate kinase, partial [Candidatus Rokuibacteriota bacterium]